MSTFWKICGAIAAITFVPAMCLSLVDNAVDDHNAAMEKIINDPEQPEELREEAKALLVNEDWEIGSEESEEEEVEPKVEPKEE